MKLHGEHRANRLRRKGADSRARQPTGDKVVVSRSYVHAGDALPVRRAALWQSAPASGSMTTGAMVAPGETRTSRS